MSHRIYEKSHSIFFHVIEKLLLPREETTENLNKRKKREAEKDQERRYYKVIAGWFDGKLSFYGKRSLKRYCFFQNHTVTAFDNNSDDD